MFLHAFIRFHMLSYAFICFYMLLKLYKQAKVSEEQEVRWSHVYRLFPAEAGKKVRH